MIQRAHRFRECRRGEAEPLQDEGALSCAGETSPLSLKMSNNKIVLFFSVILLSAKIPHVMT